MNQQGCWLGAVESPVCSVRKHRYLKKQYFGVPFRTVMSPIIVSGGRCYKTG